MFSFVKKFVSALSGSSDLYSDDSSEDELTILNNINTLSLEPIDLGSQEAETPPELLGRSKSEESTFEITKVTRKSGKVTFICPEYGIIDNTVYFKPSHVCDDVQLKVNDDVIYSAYKAKENETDRIGKLYSMEKGLLGWKNSSSMKSDGHEKFEEEVVALSRVIVGRITQRRGREIYVESANLWCNLDNIETSYIPFEGDWVELQVISVIDPEKCNLAGEVIEVKSLKPIMKKSGLGKVSSWSKSRGEGIIDNKVYFSHFVCDVGFVPNVGDEVIYEAVESDQFRCKWRALKVSIPKCKKKMTSRGGQARSECEKESNQNSLCQEKMGVCIKPTLCKVEVGLEEVKKLTMEVTNNGETPQLLVSSGFEKPCSQMTLLSPKEENLNLGPGENIPFVFECKGSQLGLMMETYVFTFKNFKIGKKIEIQVTGSKEMNKFLECKLGTVFRVFEDKEYMKTNEKSTLTLYGPRPWKPPKFISKENKCVFNIPPNLWTMCGSGTQKIKDPKCILEEAPYLKENLKFSIYGDSFHTLLYLEEIEIRVNFRKYDMNGTSLKKRSDYLVLEVPGLVEKRPSIVVGDKVIMSQSWSDSDRTNYIGYIHETREKEIFIKFHHSFHQMYDGTECNIIFEPNVNFFSKAHDAVNRAIRVLGEDWLFPSAIKEKPPQVFFNIPEEDSFLATYIPVLRKDRREMMRRASKEKSDLNNSFGKQRPTLTWANKNLNNRQKLAVVSVVLGQGRPLPYIIFGPPGTGKTITMVETIIQIYRLVPDCRILITTPSNSSADLICERLVDFSIFQPGELVRLLALYRVHEGLIPPKLIPFATYYSGYQNMRKIHTLYETSGNTQIHGSSMCDFTGKHKVTVATCAAIALLHYHGLPNGHFTHILVDEAGQTSEPEVLLSATFQNTENSQLVLTGDPQQLGPVVFSPIAKKFGLGTSLMQRLSMRFPYKRNHERFTETSGYDPRFITKLNINYRTIPEILSLPSQLFYNSDLIPKVSQTDSLEASIVEKFNFKVDGRTTPAAIIFHGIIGQNYQENDSPSWFNPHEIWQVVFFVKKLYSLGLTSDDIGIVTPYSKQVQKLRILLPSLNLSIPKIGSVEEFQGQERAVIIVSTVRSSPKFVRSDVFHCLGFVACPQRLNVALTRARALLIIIGNPILLSNDPYWLSVVKYCWKNNSYTGCHLKILEEKDGPEGDKKTNDPPLSQNDPSSSTAPDPQTG